MKIESVMTVDPVCCYADETSEQAAKLMEQFDVGVIPITETQDSFKLVGLITDRDIALSVVARGKDPQVTPLSDCMSNHVVCCHPDDDVNDVIMLMRQHQVRRIPVVDNENNIAGMVSIADLVESEDVNPLMKDVSKEENVPHE